MPEFYTNDICPKKISKMPEFYMIFAQKIFFPPCPPVSYAYETLYCQNLESLGYIFVAEPDSMDLSSFGFSWWAPKDACALKQSE